MPQLQHGASDAVDIAAPTVSAPAASSSTHAIIVEPLLSKLDDGNPFRVRQRGAHALAALLAHEDTPALLASVEHLRKNSPVPRLVRLGAEAEVSSDGLTLQLVCSCLANLAARLVPVVEAGAVGRLLARIILTPDANPTLLNYALAATYNLSADIEVLAALDESGCGVVLASIGRGKHSISTDDAARRNAKGVLRNLKHALRAAKRSNRLDSSHAAKAERSQAKTDAATSTAPAQQADAPAVKGATTQSHRAASSVTSTTTMAEAQPSAKRLNVDTVGAVAEDRGQAGGGTAPPAVASTSKALAVEAATTADAEPGGNAASEASAAAGQAKSAAEAEVAAEMLAEVDSFFDEEHKTAVGEVDGFLAEEEEASATPAPASAPSGAEVAGAPSPSPVKGIEDVDGLIAEEEAAAAEAVGEAPAEETARITGGEHTPPIADIQVDEIINGAIMDGLVEEEEGHEMAADVALPALPTADAADAALLAAYMEDVDEEDVDGVSPGMLRTMLMMHSVEEVGAFLAEELVPSMLDQASDGIEPAGTAVDATGDAGLLSVVQAPNKILISDTDEADVFEDIDEYVLKFMMDEQG